MGDGDLAEGGGDGLNQNRLLVWEDGAEIEDEVVGFDAGDDADSGGGAAEALFELRGGVSGASDTNEFRGERLGGG